MRRSLFRPSLAIVSFVLACSAGCSSNASFVWAARHPSLGKAPPARALAGDDRISVFVSDHAELSGEYVISREGRYVQPLVGPLNVGGLTTLEVEDLVRRELSPYVQSPRVAVTLISLHMLRVNALGEVRTPGQFTVSPEETVLDVLGRAGGLTDFADSTSIYLVRTWPPERIRFRYADLTQPDITAHFLLRDGDTLVVE